MILIKKSSIISTQQAFSSKVIELQSSTNLGYQSIAQSFS